MSMGHSPPRENPHCSITAAANKHATPASTALPPFWSILMPASPTNGCPAATTPRFPVTRGLNVLSTGGPSGAGKTLTVKSTKLRTAIIAFAIQNRPDIGHLMEIPGFHSARGGGEMHVETIPTPGEYRGKFSSDVRRKWRGPFVLSPRHSTCLGWFRSRTSAQIAAPGGTGFLPDC